jgi:hypothetical protein
MIPISYFVLVPQYLQYRIDKLGTPGNEVSIFKLGVGEMSDTQIPFSGKFRIDALVPFPILGGFKDFKMYAYVGDEALAQIEMPPASFWLNQQVNLDVQGKIIMDTQNQQNTQKLIAKFSSPEGLKDLKVKVKFAPPITAFGFTAYSSLPLKKDIHVGDVAGKASVLLEGARSASKAASGLIFVDPNPNNKGSFY